MLKLMQSLLMTSGNFGLGPKWKLVRPVLSEHGGAVTAAVCAVESAGHRAAFAGGGERFVLFQNITAVLKKDLSVGSPEQ